MTEVNTDDNPLAAPRLGVQGIPTMILFQGGKKVDRVVGAMPKASLECWLGGVVTA